ncbi:MAG TPA: GntR family transcriptional regulator, partial [Candidatus Limnocylindrales bacterium]
MSKFSQAPPDGNATPMENTFAGYTLERGPVPLYHQVYLHLVDALAHGEWKRGDQIPTERELATIFDCSLITIRRA